MRTLKQILREFYVPADVLGGEVNREHLIEELKKLRKDLNRRTWLLTLIILFLFLFSIGTLLYLHDPKQIASIFSVLGIGTVWTTVTQMSKLWKEVARINLIIALCMSLEPTEIHNIIKILIEADFTQLRKKTTKES